MIDKHALFGRYVSDIDGFLQTMKSTNSVVVGEAVLSTFEPKFRRSTEVLEIIPSCLGDSELGKLQTIWGNFLLTQSYKKVSGMNNEKVGQMYCVFFLGGF